jgi:sRNA-binding regulator protein Hfq
MASKGAKPSEKKAPSVTHKEVEYLNQLIKARKRVRIRLSDDTEHEGYLEYYDEAFLRLTRDLDANLFIFKHDIKYLYEVG